MLSFWAMFRPTFALISMVRFALGVVFCHAASLGVAAANPGASWETVAPETAGLDSQKLVALSNFAVGSGVVVRDGKIAYSWGDISSPVGWASASKPVLSTFLFLAVTQGRCSFGTTMGEYNPGGTLKDRSINFHQLANMISGYSRAEAPGWAYAYNDVAINLYGRTLFLGVYGAPPSQVFAQELAFLQFEDSPEVSDVQYGRLLGVSVRDYARLGVLWIQRGEWDGVQRIQPAYFDLVQNQVPETLPITMGDGAESWNYGTFGGGDHQDDTGPGDYGYNFWVNTNGYWPAMPTDMFVAAGDGGNRTCTVIPSLDIVVASTGNFSLVNQQAYSLLLDAVLTTVSNGEGPRSTSWGRLKSAYRPTAQSGR